MLEGSKKGRRSGLAPPRQAQKGGESLDARTDAAGIVDVADIERASVGVERASVPDRLPDRLQSASAASGSLSTQIYCPPSTFITSP